ncbi:MAG: glycosyltransferase family 1 protein [Proteobacteria bacterium]|nr:glycosyltransferase family 1 protein [Pseudomonadota bacterium]
MMRVLFVVPPLTGHINPTLSVGAELLSRGHEVGWLGHASKLAGRLPRGGTLLALGEGDPAHAAAVSRKARSVRGMAALKVFWEDFIAPLARASFAETEERVTAFAPDLLVVDHQAVAGALVARKLGIRWVTSATTSASLGDALDAFPKVAEWQREQVLQIQRDVGVDPVANADVSPERVIIFSTPEVAGERSSYPDQAVFVGPAIATGRSEVAFPWDALQDRAKVLVSLGTVNSERGKRFYDAVCTGLGAEDLQVILVAPESLVPDPPPNVIRRDFVPQLALLPHLDAVVCHAGHNTTCEALAHGLPVVLLPITDDQPVVAAQVVTAGAGVRVPFGRVTAAKLSRAVRTVLDEPAYRDAARTIQASFEGAGGAVTAADVILALG